MSKIDEALHFSTPGPTSDFEIELEDLEWVPTSEFERTLLELDREDFMRNYEDQHGTD